MAEIITEKTEKGDVVTIVTYIDDAVVRGRFKWKYTIDENAALKIVLKQFTLEELRKIATVTLEPIEPMPWLKSKKVYEFCDVKKK